MFNVDSFVKTPFKFQLEHPKKKSKKSPGTIHLNFFKFHKNYSFLEYLRGGLVLIVF